MNKLRVTDAHIHWWDLENHSYPWLENIANEQGGRSNLGGLAHTYLKPQLMRDSNCVELEAVVHVEADYDPSNRIGETQYLSQLLKSAKYADLAVALVGFADFLDPNVEKLLEQQASYPQVRAIRQMLNFLADEPNYCWANQAYLQSPQWHKNFGLLAKYNLGFDLMCFYPQMHSAAELFKQHPDIPVVLEHGGMPRLGELEHWKKAIANLAQLPNVSCKVGGFGTMIEDWSFDQIKPYVEWLFECFGIERVMYASNFPTESTFSNYDKTVVALDSLTSHLSDSQRDMFFRSNARRIYRF